VRKLTGLAAVAAFLVVSGLAEARPPRTGTVMTPFGPVYDTGSPEWKMSGGNPFVYEQIMEQKMMMLQQQMLLKQQQMLLKQQKGKGATLTGPTPTGPGNVFSLPARNVKKKRRTYDPSHPVTGSASKATTPATAAPGASKATKPPTP
jgi:hypothetical protein